VKLVKSDDKNEGFKIFQFGHKNYETPSLPQEGRVGVEWIKLVGSMFRNIAPSGIQNPEIVNLSPFSPGPSFPRERRGNLPTGLQLS